MIDAVQKLKKNTKQNKVKLTGTSYPHQIEKNNWWNGIGLKENAKMT